MRYRRGSFRAFLWLPGFASLATAFILFLVVFDAPRNESESSWSPIAFVLIIPLGIFAWITTGAFPGRYALIGGFQVLFLALGLIAGTGSSPDKGTRYRGGWAVRAGCLSPIAAFLFLLPGLRPM